MKKSELSKRLEQFIAGPDGELRLGKVRVGRIELTNISLTGREAGINFQEFMLSMCDKTRRFRIRKDGTRYIEPLPMGSPARLLSAEIADYLRDMQRRNLQLTTITASARTLKILLIVCGDIPVHRIKHDQIYLLWDFLRWAPANITTAVEFKGLSAEQIIERGKAEGVSAPAVATYELHRRFLSTFFKALVEAHAIPFSPMAPFKEMKRDLMENADKPDRLFNADDLKKIFNPSTFIPWAKKFPHRWWCPIIGLYTGARINEVAQLKVNDIFEEQGVWCMAIRKTVDADLKGSQGAQSRQRLKGKSAVRTIPLPHGLLDAGIVEFWEDMKACGHPRLFPHLSAGTNKASGETNSRYSQALLIQFGTYLKELGFPKGVGFHAFRHTLATELDAQGIRVEDIALITGHSLSKKVPVLEDAYIHKAPEGVRTRQVRALMNYTPSVIVPLYTSGQFKERLGKAAKFYP